MNIDQGFEIEHPKAFVRWEATEEDLKSTLGKELRHVTKGYYTITCKTLGGIEHELGFHFSPRKHGVLTELEFFRRSYEDQADSYNEFQRHLVATFGKPHKSSPGNEGFESHEWNIGRNTIVHYVHNRFGPEEHMRIKHAI
jgi:hypothetical protein